MNENRRLNNEPVVLIYKRTHKGDPCSKGVFGVYDCMGKVRNRKYDAVIGIGGKCPDVGHEDIAYKINWIGIMPEKMPPKSNKHRGPWVTFKKFCLYEEDGECVKKIAPELYDYMYGKPQRRVLMSTSLPPGSEIFSEVKKILSLADDCSPSQGCAANDRINRKCK